MTSLIKTVTYLFNHLNSYNNILSLDIIIYFFSITYTELFKKGHYQIVCIDYV